MTCSGVSECSGSTRPENSHALILSDAVVSPVRRLSIAGTSPPNVVMLMGGTGIARTYP